MSENIILKLNNKRFCAFCGKEITPSDEGQFTCQCKDAKTYRDAERKAWQLKFEAAKIMDAAPKPKFILATTISQRQDCTPYAGEDDEPSVCLE